MPQRVSLNQKTPSSAQPRDSWSAQPQSPWSARPQESSWRAQPQIIPGVPKPPGVPNPKTHTPENPTVSTQPQRLPGAPNARVSLECPSPETRIAGVNNPRVSQQSLAGECPNHNDTLTGVPIPRNSRSAQTQRLPEMPETPCPTPETFWSAQNIIFALFPFNGKQGGDVRSKLVFVFVVSGLAFIEPSAHLHIWGASPYFSIYVDIYIYIYMYTHIDP